MRLPIIGTLFVVLLISMDACQSQDEIKKAQFFTNGKSLYTTHCGNCHGEQGEGLGNLYPPLTDTAFIRNKRAALPCIVKYGLHEKLTINERFFDTAMPGNGTLSPQEIAYILTYVGNSFGNELGLVHTEEITNSLTTCNEAK